MAARTWVLATILATAALAGCTNPQDDQPDLPAPAAPEAPAPAPAPGNPAGGSGGEAAPAPRPSDFELTDAGNIQGPFEKAWDFQLASHTYRGTHIVFALDGVQPGTPPTAHINLALQDPLGTTLRTTTLGLGGNGNVADWTFAPGELPAAGTYRLVATPGEVAPLPSLGLATYGVHITIDY